jgi:hypothetical protein
MAIDSAAGTSFAGPGLIPGKDVVAAPHTVMQRCGF